MPSTRRTHAPVEVDYPPLPAPRIAERLRGFCQERQLARQWEAWGPCVLGFLASLAAAWAAPPHASVAAIVAQVLPVTLVVTAILAGHVMVALAWLLVLMDRPVLARLRASGHYDALIGYFWEAGRSIACFVAVAILILVLNACGGWRLPAHDRLVPTVLAGCFTWACSNGLRMNRLMFKLLLYKDAPPPAA